MLMVYKSFVCSSARQHAYILAFWSLTLKKKPNILTMVFADFDRAQGQFTDHLISRHLQEEQLHSTSYFLKYEK